MGESAALSTLVDQGFTEAERETDWADLAEAYLGSMRQRGWKGVDRFVDKTLENHLRVGMMHLMFPTSVILESTRDPRDDVLIFLRMEVDPAEGVLGLLRVKRNDKGQHGGDAAEAAPGDEAMHDFRYSRG